MSLSKNAINLLKQRYCHQGENPKEVYKRVANALSLGDTKFEKKMQKSMENGIFLPNSPCIRNAGQKKSLLHACFVLDIQDTMESISDTLKHMIIIFKNGGGVGINFSKLRTKNSVLTTGGTSSGVVSFMKLFDVATEVVKQGGFRRGALMGVLNFEHAEIIDFIRSKLTNQLTNFNISVLVSDKFMEKVEKGENIDLINPQDEKVWNTINAKTIFDVIAFSAWNSGDPGFLFYDRINKDNINFPKIKIKCSNPCITGDTLIAVADGRNAIPIKQLFLEDKNVPVYCQDEEARKNGKLKVVIKNAKNPRKTGENIDIYKVTLDDGSSIKATKNHNFMLRNGEYKELKDLKVGDSLMPFNTQIQNGYITINSNGRYWKRQFRLIWENINKQKQPTGFHIHHKDFNKLNDNINNLILTKIEDHKKIHDISGDKNPMRRFPEKNWMNNPIKQLEFRLKNHIGKKRSMQTCLNISKALKGRTIPWNKGKTNVYTKDTLEKISNSRLGKSVEEMGHKLNCSCFICKAKRNKLYYNHRIIKIEYIGKEDVYNLTVDDNHNYMVVTKYNKDRSSTGICVKNCGESPLPPYGACCLGSINISKFVKNGKFNFDQFAKAIEIATRSLRNMNAVSWYPLPEITRVMKELDPIGVGIMGFADTLIMLGINYDSEECLKFIDEICKPYKEITDKLASKCFWKRIIAPTGSLSILADCSSGIEPIFDTTFERHLTVGIIEETREIYKSKYCRTAHQISPEWHLKIQAQFQKWLDGSISKTINLPNEASVDDVKAIYMQAWKLGCKGITIFRENSKEGVLKRKTKCDGDSCHL